MYNTQRVQLGFQLWEGVVKLCLFGEVGREVHMLTSLFVSEEAEEDNEDDDDDDSKTGEGEVEEEEEPEQEEEGYKRNNND